MSLRRFLNVAYAILVEEYQRMGSDLVGAMKKLNDLSEPPVAGAPVRSAPAAVAASNAASMELLKGMLQDVPNAPTNKRKRK